MLKSGSQIPVVGQAQAGMALRGGWDELVDRAGGGWLPTYQDGWRGKEVEPAWEGAGRLAAACAAAAHQWNVLENSRLVESCELP